MAVGKLALARAEVEKARELVFFFGSRVVIGNRVVK